MPRTKRFAGAAAKSANPAAGAKKAKMAVKAKALGGKGTGAAATTTGRGRDTKSVTKRSSVPKVLSKLPSISIILEDIDDYDMLQTLSLSNYLKNTLYPTIINKKRYDSDSERIYIIYYI